MIIDNLFLVIKHFTLFFYGVIILTIKLNNLWGGVRFSTGGIVREHLIVPTGCNSLTDSIVWMKKDTYFAVFFRLIRGGFFTEAIMKKINTKTITGLSILAAMSIVLTLIPFLRFSIIPSAPFLEYDAADIPIMIGTFMYGPVYGLLLTVIVSAFQGLTVSAASGIYGIIMHIIATGTFTLIGGFIYKFKKDIKGALLGLILGALTAAAVMIPANLFITPFYMGAPMSTVVKLLLPAIIPFNLIKFGINASLCFLLYKRIHKTLDFITKGIDKKKSISL